MQAHLATSHRATTLPASPCSADAASQLHLKALRWRTGSAWLPPLINNMGLVWWPGKDGCLHEPTASTIDPKWTQCCTTSPADTNQGAAPQGDGEEILLQGESLLETTGSKHQTLESDSAAQDRSCFNGVFMPHSVFL